MSDVGSEKEIAPETLEETIENANYVETGQGKRYHAPVKGKESIAVRKQIKKAKKKQNEDQSYLHETDGAEEGTFAGEMAVSSFETPAGVAVIKGRREHQKEMLKNYQTTVNQGKNQLLTLTEQIKRLQQQKDSIESEVKEIERAKDNFTIEGEGDEEENQISASANKAKALGKTKMTDLTLDDYLLALGKFRGGKNV